MNRSLSGNGIVNPQHPSLEGSRRGHVSGSRSYPQLPSETSDRSGRVRFENEENGMNGFLNLFLDVSFGMVALVCSMGLVTLLVLLYIIVRPFSVSIARRLSAQVGAASFLDAMALLLPNTKIYLTGDSDIPSPVGTSVLVCNHLVDGDWYALMMLGRCVGLRGSVKVFLRNEILNLKENGVSPTNTARRNSPPNGIRSSFTGSTSGSTSTARAALTNATSPSSSSSSSRHPTSSDLSMAAALLHTFLDFPLMNGEDYISKRETMFQLLRSFADRGGSESPVHLLLFPEGWSMYNNGENRKSVLARSNEFAKREGRPQLRHLLLPRTTGFNASLDCLRESSPVVYDVTMAYRGYTGSLPPKLELSLVSLWNHLRRNYPEEVHIRIKRYSMEEVLQDAKWLDKKWAEKDRLLNHFSRHNCFPADSRGFARHRIFDTRFHSVETSIVALLRFLLLPCAVPIFILLFIPIVWTVFWFWLLYTSYKLIFPDPSFPTSARDSTPTNNGESGQIQINPSSNPGTPFIPATPFGSPLLSTWRDMLGGNN